MSAVDVLVAIPAHNEAETIESCLAAVGAAAATAQRTGAVRRVRVAVSAHRCTDDTARRAAGVLAELPGVEALVLEEPRVLTVGGLRTRLIAQASAGAEPLPHDAWVFCTDADTLVPQDWLTGTLRQAAERGAVLVLGLADLMDWAADDTARQAYAELLERGIADDGHEHAYAANLAVRLDVLRRVGGFPSVPHGEEHGLAAAVRRAGLGIISTFHPRVQTSARMPGRAAEGLGALLARLAHVPQTEGDPGPAVEPV
ncbi:MAG: acylphosphatase [Friedmanniella sp.]|nr:acylphosphatase [Friedmanniella sp.]